MIVVQNNVVVHKVLSILKSKPLLVALLFLLAALVLNLKAIFGKKEVEKLPTLGATITGVDVSKIVANLYQAMNRAGTDEQAIYEALKNLSMGDFARVYNAFGLRNYVDTFGESGNWISGTDRDLVYWLNAELNDKEKQHIRELNPNLTIF